MSGSLYHEAHNALAWLLDGAAEDSDVYKLASALTPKSAGYLLPLVDGIRQREKIAAYERLPFIYPVLWGMRLLVFRLRNREKLWPETMEINLYSQPGNKNVNTSTMGGERPVLLVASMQSYGAMIAGLAKALSEHKIRCVILAPEASCDWGCFKELPDNVELKALESYLEPGVFKQFEEDKALAQKQWPSHEKRIAIDGPRALKDALAIAPESVRYIFTNVNPQGRAFKNIANKAMKTINPKALVVTRLKRFTENIFAQSAKESQVPVILANHGHIGAGWDPFSLGSPDILCDSILAWNDEQKKIWISLYPDLDLDKVNVVGGVLWDGPVRKYNSDNVSAKKEARRSLNKAIKASGQEALEDDKLFITITIDEAVNRVLPEVLSQIDKINGVTILIKTRPHESRADWANIEAFRNVTLISKEVKVNLHELLFASDLCVTAHSTTNIDSLAVGTPVITLEMGEKARSEERYLHLERYGLPVVKCVEELTAIAQEWAKNDLIKEKWRMGAKEAAKAYLANYPEGNAGEQIAGIVQSLSGKEAA